MTAEVVCDALLRISERVGLCEDVTAVNVRLVDGMVGEQFGVAVADTGRVCCNRRNGPDGRLSKFESGVAEVRMVDVGAVWPQCLRLTDAQF